MSHPLYVLLAGVAASPQPPNGLAIKPILLMIMMMLVSVVADGERLGARKLEEQQH